jgi:hypothetical protein
MTYDSDHDSQRPDIRPSAQAPAAKNTDFVRSGRRGGAEGTCAPTQLHICFHCSGQLVFPLDWSEEGHRHWRIVLRCPECESRREGIFEQAAVERLEDELDRAAAALLGDLRRVTHANMSDEIEFFIRALDADLIVPSDF